MTVYKRENESIEELIRRFKLEVDLSGVLKEWKSKQYHIPRNLKRRIKSSLKKARLVRENKKYKSN